jgi:hypothetical protein
MSADLKREAENRSAALAACALGAMAERLDTPTSADRDFDLVFEGGRREPLEVTSNVNPAARETSKRLEANPFALDGTRATWALSVDEYTSNKQPIDVRRIARDAPAAIYVLEAAGEVRFDPIMAYDERADVREAARALLRLGVRFGSSTLPSGAQPVLFIFSTHGGAIDADSIADTVEEAAKDPGNQGKLLAIADAPRRHLFVTPALSGGMAYMALVHIFEDNERLPEVPMPRVPELPKPITTVWAACDSGAIYVSPPDDWMMFRTPDDFWERYEDYLIAG